jgi:methylated-DNA-[protein]-cysteine S-methyltransferase
MKPTPVFHFSTFKTPAGEFSVAVDANGAVAATAFGGGANLRGRLRSGTLVANARRTAAARAQIEAWFKGERRDFSLALSPSGTPFQRKVWGALRRIPFGKTRSYGDVARAVGSSPRAVGRANATNPICLIVPCHRVIGADGSLTGFAFGEEKKQRLLDFEARETKPLPKSSEYQKLSLLDSPNDFVFPNSNYKYSRIQL